MHTSHVQSHSRPLAVLLGGSGQARSMPRSPAVPALLKPRPLQSERVALSNEHRRVGGN